MPETKFTKVVSVAPDAVVFINGLDSIPLAQGDSGLKLKSFITQITVSLSIHSSPGTASISLANPQHLEQPLINQYRSAFSAMQEVDIYIKGRFPIENETKYYPVFWGIISTVSENYSDGVYNITLNCKDILRWWDMTRINIKPSLLASNIFSSLEPSLFSKNYAQMTIPQILKELSYVTTKDLMPVENLTFSDKNSYIDKIKEFKENSYQLIQYWQNRFTQIGRRLRIIGFNNVLAESQTKEMTLQQKDQELGNVNSEVPDYLHMTNGLIKFPAINYLPSSQFFETPFPNTLVKTQNSTSEDINKVLPFVQPLIGVDGVQIDRILPAKLVVEDVNAFQSQFETRLEIANQLKELVKFEFYMDTNGDLVFKPPFYNMDVTDNAAQVIEDIDIIDYGFTEDESGIVTRLEVLGSLDIMEHFESTIQPNYGLFVDYFKAQQFGIRAQTQTLHYLRSPYQCELFAQSELNRLNSLVKTGTLSIIGRPEIRLGYPIYFKSRDTFYYLQGLTHTFSFGSDFSTSLEITAERKKLYDDQGNVLKNLALISDEDPLLKKAQNYVNEQVMFENNVNELFVKTSEKFPDLTESEILSIFSNAGLVNTTTTVSSANDLARTYDPAYNEVPFDKTRNRTLDSMNIYGNQGRSFKFVKDYKLDITQLSQLRDRIQITDESGYMLIGVFDYGRKYKVNSTSVVTPVNLEAVETDEYIKKLHDSVSMKPESENQNKETDKDDRKPTLDKTLFQELVNPSVAGVVDLNQTVLSKNGGFSTEATTESQQQKFNQYVEQQTINLSSKTTDINKMYTMKPESIQKQPVKLPLAEAKKEQTQKPKTTTTGTTTEQKPTDEKQRLLETLIPKKENETIQELHDRLRREESVNTQVYGSGNLIFMQGRVLVKQP